VFLVYGRRNDAVPDGQDAEYQLYRGGGAQQVTGHRLGGADRHLVRVFAEHLFDGGGLAGVVQLRAGTVRVDMIDVGRFDRRVVQRRLHGTSRAFTVRRGRRDVVGVAAHTDPHYFGQDLRAAAPGVLQLLDEQQAGTLTQHETVPFQVERARSPLRFVVAARQRLEGAESGQRHRRHRRLRPTGDHGVRHSGLDQQTGVRDCVGARGASRYGGVIRSLEAVCDRNVPRRHVRNHIWNKKRTDAAGSPFEFELVLGLERDEPADARTDDHPDAVSVEGIEVDAVEALAGAAGRVVHHRVGAPGVLAAHVGGGIEFLDLRGDLRIECFGIEPGYPRHRAASLDH
jgi:hypothetical protein